MNTNQYEFIKKRLAPCGLHCGRCFAFTEGGISNYSNKLKEALGNFDVYAERFVELLDEHLYKRHVSINKRIAEIGIEQYYEEIKNQSRY